MSDKTKGKLSEGWLAQEREIVRTFFEGKVPQALQKHASSEISKCTIEDCNICAAKILGSQDIRPVDNQGTASYTLICSSQNKIIQFRLEYLDKHILDLAHKIYNELVPMPILIEEFPLPTYVCSVIPGIVHILQDFPKDSFPLQRQLNTVRDLAIFIAKSAFWPQPQSTLSSDSWTTMAQVKLQSLASMKCLYQMEPRFSQKAIELSSKLYLLKKLPLVLTHIDFAEVNIMVDPLTGRLTGVLDFDGARVEAFGMCLLGVYEGFFGEIQDSKWRFFDQPAPQSSIPELDNLRGSVREVLQKAFWDTLWDTIPSWMKRQELEEPITVALEIGIINRYFDKDHDVNPQDQDDLRSVNWATGLLLDR